MRRLLLLLVLAAAGIGQAWADRTPAGYVVGVSLAGSDKTPVRRDAQWIAAKLMMPLYAGDVVELHDAASVIEIDQGAAEQVKITGDGKPHDVSGQVVTGDDATSVLAAIGTVLGGDEQGGAENMAAREGEAIEVAIARRGTNLIGVGRQKLWLAWTGGKAPFTVSVKGAAAMTVRDRQVEVPLKLKPGERATIEISDGVAGRAHVDVKAAARPQPPAQLGDTGSSILTVLIELDWLLQQNKGAWRLEAAQGLHDHAKDQQVAAALLAKLQSGWSP